MRYMSRTLVTVGAIAALALTGCASGQGQSGAASGEGSGAAQMPTATINKQDRDSLQQGGELRLAITSLPASYNGMSTDGNDSDARDIADNYLMPTNWNWTEDGQFEPNPDYMESYEVTDATETEPQVVTVKLNPEAKWNDGTPITWEDYQASWQACNGENPEFLCASTDGYNQVASIEQGENEFEVVATFKTSYPDWNGVFSNVYPKAGVGDPESFNEGWREPKNEWTAGPFIVDNVDEAEQVVTLVPNPNWWGNPAILDKVTMRVLDTAAIGNAFANSEIDVLSGIISADQYEQVMTRSDAEVRAAGGTTWRHYTFNTESGALADKAVRQAIAKGINRPAVAASALAGIGGVDPTEQTLGNHFFMPGQEGYQDNSGDYAYDPEKAGQELDELGWTMDEASGFRVKDGETLTIDFATITGVSTSQNEAQLFQSDMAKIGVKVNLSPADSDSYFTDVVAGGKFGVTVFGWVGTNWPMANVGQIYGCDTSLAKNGGSNYTNYCDEELKALIPEIDTEMDHEKRIELTNQADQMIWDDVLVVPTYRRPELVATPKNLANYGSFGPLNHHMEDVGFMAE